MRFPSECRQIHQTLRHTMPHLAEAQSKGLALWTFGTITAQSGRQNAVIAALNFTGGFSAVRQRLREWLCDGADRSAPLPKRTDVRARFRAAHAVGLVAVDVQRHRARHRPYNALRPTVRHRRERGLSGMRHPRRAGRHARQQAWQVNRPGMRAANRLSVAIPASMRAIAMTGRGLRSPKLWEKIRSFGWRPYMSRRIDTVFRIDGWMRILARRPVSAQGRSFIGSGTAFRAKSKRLRGTIIVIWDEGQDEP